ncbi:MAG: DUF937 domain-containing protein [Bacteroidales bacterium]|nr:DUF937 domain-containing protein [Bacteroidales bacterium]
MDLSKLISSLTDNEMIGEISKKLNIDKNQITSVIQSAIPQFLNAMKKNAATADGAAALTQALGNHAGQSFALNLEDGKKILSKVFGGNLESILSSLGKQTGVAKDQVSNILASIAPKLLSVLGSLKLSGNIGDLLGSILGGSTAQGSGKSILGGLLNKLIKK